MFLAVCTIISFTFFINVWYTLHYNLSKSDIEELQKQSGSLDA